MRAWTSGKTTPNLDTGLGENNMRRGTMAASPGIAVHGTRLCQLTDPVFTQLPENAGNKHSAAETQRDIVQGTGGGRGTSTTRFYTYEQFLKEGGSARGTWQRSRDVWPVLANQIVALAREGRVALNPAKEFFVSQPTFTGRVLPLPPAVRVSPALTPLFDAKGDGSVKRAVTAMVNALDRVNMREIREAWLAER